MSLQIIYALSCVLLDVSEYMNTSKALLKEIYSFLHFSAHMKYSDGVFQWSVYAYTMTYMELVDNTGLYACKCLCSSPLCLLNCVS